MNEETIFAAALEKKTPGERQAFLDAACAGDPSMRAAVEELLRADSDAGSFLDHPPIELDATLASDASSRDTVDEAGWVRSLPFLKPCDKPDRIGTIDQYEVIEVVGHGGMGAVLRAFDTKLSRVVAVKVMSPTLAANPTAVKRFLREATTAAAVHHDHVVTIHAVDESHQPPYLVMQFIEGQTLQQKIDREGALELKHILRIGSQAAAGLAAAHKVGLIHRDVKPANILLENGVERVKITDFGLARSADDLQITQTGLIAGTPQYMSPEQARGEPIDARSDLFSLGSVLYTMCTGRPAFRADHPVAVLRRVCDDTPRPIREVNPDVPEWLEAIVGKLLAKDPADRFQSAAEVAELLSQHLAHVQNPAIAPRPTFVAAPPHLPRSSGLWRDGNLLVMHRNAPLPDVCLKSNTQAPRRLKRRVAWHHPAIYLAFFVNPILYLILALVLQKSATIYIPLSDEWFLRRRQRMTFAWGAVLGGFALTWALAHSISTGKLATTFDGAAEPLLMILAGCLILFGVIYGLLACRLVSAARMTDDYIWLRGVHRDFLNRLEVWGLSPLAYTAPGGIPAAIPAKQTEPPLRFEPPFWLWGTGLALAVLAMLVAVLKVALGMDVRPIAPISIVLVFVFVTTLAGWAFFVQLQRLRARRPKHLEAEPHRPIGRGVLVEHPVLGVVAILMLLTSASAATYMLTAAVYRSLTRATLVLDSSSSDAAVTAYQNGKQVAELRRTWYQARLPAGVYDLVIDAGPSNYSGIGELTIDSGPDHGKSIIRMGRGDGGLPRTRHQFAIQLNPGSRTVIGVRSAEDTNESSGRVAPPSSVETPAASISSGGVEWVSLFNGKDLAGWKMLPDKPEAWRVVDGELIGSGGTSYLFSDRSDFEEFHLRVEAKINDGGESGVYFRVPSMKVHRYGAFPEGYEANINSTHPTDEERTGSLTGSLRGVVHHKTALHKPGEWFTMEVLAQGQHIQIKVNGQTTINFVDANNSFRRGHVALQVWLADTEVRFRKIEIKEIRPSEANVES